MCIYRVDAVGREHDVIGWGHTRLIDYHVDSPPIYMYGKVHNNYAFQIIEMHNVFNENGNLLYLAEIHIISYFKQ